MSKHHHDFNFNDRSSTAALLATRRSGKPRNMVAPGPDETQLQRILHAAVRVPDHGKLHPWRFVVIGPEKRGAFAELLKQALIAEGKASGDKPRDKHFEAAEDFAQQAPCLVVAISEPVQPSKIPLWEQELSCGAACQNLLVAAHAEGFIGGWLTEWPAYSNTVTAAFTQHGRIAGFIFLGTPGHALEERPRPVFENVVTHWQG
jgi:nitroreductase